MSRKVLLIIIALILASLLGCGRAEPFEAVATTEGVSDSKENLEDTIQTEQINETVPVKDTPEFTVGEVAGNTYRNEYFDLVYQLDEGWTFASGEELAEVNGLYVEFRLDIEQKLQNGETYMLMKASNMLENVNIVCSKTSAVVEAAGIDSYLVLTQAEMELTDWSGYGVQLVSSEIVEIEFMGAPTSALQYTMQYIDYGISTCGTVVVVEQGGYMVNLTATAQNAENAARILKRFAKINVEETVNGGYKQNSGSGAFSEYHLSALPATISVSTDFHVYSLESEITEEMCASQGVDLPSVQSYLQLCGYDMIILPAAEPFLGANFEIDVRVKAEKEYGVDNLKYLDSASTKMAADMLVSGFGTKDYSIYENDTAKYIVFDCTIAERQRRYATIINDKMVYFIIKTGEKTITLEQDEMIREIIDSLSYS